MTDGEGIRRPPDYVCCPSTWRLSERISGVVRPNFGPAERGYLETVEVRYQRIRNSTPDETAHELLARVRRAGRFRGVIDSRPRHQLRRAIPRRLYNKEIVDDGAIGDLPTTALCDHFFQCAAHFGEVTNFSFDIGKVITGTTKNFRTGIVATINQTQ